MLVLTNGQFKVTTETKKWDRWLICGLSCWFPSSKVSGEANGKSQVSVTRCPRLRTMQVLFNNGNWKSWNSCHESSHFYDQRRLVRSISKLLWLNKGYLYLFKKKGGLKKNEQNIQKHTQVCELLCRFHCKTKKTATATVQKFSINAGLDLRP